MSTWMPPISQALLAQALAKNPQAAKGAVPPPAAPQSPPMATAQQAPTPQAQPQIPPLIARPAPTADDSINELQQNATASRQMPRSTPPAPTDDPGITSEMRKALEPVNSANAALDTEQKRYEGIANQYSQMKPPDYRQDFKPHGARNVAGTILSYIPDPIAHSIGNRLENLPQFNRANQQYGEQRAQLGQQLDAERGMIPVAESRARVAQQGFANQLDLRKENREEQTAQSNSEYKKDLNDIRQMYDSGRIEEAQRRLDETAEKNKNNFGVQNELLQVRQQLADAASQRANQSGGGPGGGMSAGQQREFNSRTRSLQREMDRIEKDRSDVHKGLIDMEQYGKPASPLLQKRMSDYDKQINDLQTKIDAAHDDIMGKAEKNSAPPSEVTPPGSGGFKPPAGVPSKPPGPNKGAIVNGKRVAYSTDGVTWGPVPDWLAKRPIGSSK